MADLRHRRRLTAKAVYLKCYAEHNLSERLSPLSGEVVDNVKTFKSIIEQDNDTEVTEADFKKSLSSVARFQTKWRKQFDLDILKKIGIDSPTEADIPRLSLAASYMICTRTKIPLFYHDLPNHSCCKLTRGCPSERWDLQCLWHPRRTVDGIWQLIREASMDPESASIDDMDTLDARFFCRKSRCMSDRQAMNWRSAV